LPTGLLFPLLWFWKFGDFYFYFHFFSKFFSNLHWQNQSFQIYLLPKCENSLPKNDAHRQPVSYSITITYSRWITWWKIHQKVL
jgi:hypothetical protein